MCFFTFLLLLWGGTCFFTIDRDLPSRYTPETDGITARLDLSAKEMMRSDTYKYPPLQYLIVKSIAGDTPEKTLTKEELLSLRTKRIILYRMTSAVMGLLTAYLLFASAIFFLKLPYLYAFGAGGLFLILPLVLFYSQSANMDMPCTFWFILSFFLAVFSEYKYGKKENKKKYIFTHLLAGIACGCAFCTKDQVYSLYILPGIFFIYWKWKEEKNLFKGFFPAVLWGIGFLFSTLFIYFLIGFEVILPHFKWITTEGSSPYAAAGSGIFDRMKLLWMSFLDLGRAMDHPLLILLFVSTIFLYRKREEYKKENGLFFLAVLLFLALLSQFLFFCQVVRYSQVRYFLPLLPLVILFCIFILHKEMCRKEYKKKFCIPVAVLIFWQCGIAGEYLYSLTASPLALLKKEIIATSLYKEVRINTLLAQVGEKYFQGADGKVEKRKCIRSWGTFLGLEEYGIRDMMMEDIFFFLMKPDLVICNKELPEKEKDFLVLQKFYFPYVCIIPSLYKETGKDKFFLYSVRRKINTLPDFRKKNISEQLIRLNYLLPFHSNFTIQEMKMIGNFLAPFSVPDNQNYLIRPYMYKFLFDAYMASGRKEEAEKCKRFASFLLH